MAPSRTDRVRAGSERAGSERAAPVTAPTGGTALVARLDNAGDVLLAGPAVRAVAAQADEVVLLAGPHGRAAAELLPGVDRVLEWRAPWIDPEPEAVTPGHVALPPEAERALSLAHAAGYRLPAGDDGRLAVRRLLPDVSALTGAPGYVVLHPGVSVPARAWPAERCAQAVGALVAAGYRVLVTGAPGERELTARVAGKDGVDLGGATDLGTLAAVLDGARAVVVGNTGPAHLAAAVGTPVVSLFSPVVPAARWAPYGVPVVLLGDQDAPCRGTRARRCPVPGHPCLAGVTATEVVDAVDSLPWDAERADRSPAQQIQHGTARLYQEVAR
jgi:ADP-heptose:LPS heptosyltransferase